MALKTRGCCLLHLEWSEALIEGPCSDFFANSGEAFGRGEKIESSRYSADPGFTSNDSEEEESGVSSPEGQVSSSSAHYSCKKCKRIVAYQENIIPHDPLSGESSFRWRGRGGGGTRRWGGEDDDPACTAVFVEPMKWMTQGILLLF